MTTIQIIGSIWAFVAVCALLFNHGAHRKTREERRIRMMEEVS